MARSDAGRARRRRRAPAAALALVLALVLVLAGCGGDGEDDAEPPDEETTSSSGLTADQLPVLIVEEPILAGTEANAALGDGLLRVDAVTQAQFPENAVVSIELIEGMVATRDLQPDTIVLAGMFLPPASESSTPTTDATDASPSTDTDSGDGSDDGTTTSTS